MPLTAVHRQRARGLALRVALVCAVLGSGGTLLPPAAVPAAAALDARWLELAQRGMGAAWVALGACALLAGVGLCGRRLLQAVRDGPQTALRVQDLFDRHPQPMWYYDPHSLAFLRVNAAAVRLYGHSPAEFLAMAVPDLREAAEREALARKLRARPPGVVAVEQVRHRSKSGRWLNVQITARDARHAGRPAVLVLAVDLSALVAAQQALQRQEQRFRELHQSLAEVLWMASPDGSEVIHVSPAFDTVYGMPAAAFQRDPSLWLALVHPDDRARALASAQALQTEGSTDCQYRICRPDGQVRWLSDRKKLVRDAQGQVSMIAGIAEDITQRRLDQDALRRSTDELAERCAELARFNRAAVDRELDMIALKREVNALSRALALPPPYPVDAAATAAGTVGAA